MKKTIAIITLVAGLILSCIVNAEPLSITVNDTIDTILSAQKGKRVTIKLKAGDDLTGIVGEVNQEIVQLRELTGKEYYDAVVVLQGIEAVIIRTHE
jgi:hypothetical protein